MAPRPVERIIRDPEGMGTKITPSNSESGLRATDVLMGRGSGPSQNEGNRRFRAVVWETYQEYEQQEMAAKQQDSGGDGAKSNAPIWMNAGTKGRLCRIVKAKIDRMKGRFLQKVTSADAGGMDDDSLVCATEPHLKETKTAESGEAAATVTKKTFYKIVDDRLVLDKIKQTFRFLLDQKYGRKGSSSDSTDVGVSVASPDRKETIEHSSAAGMTSPPKNDLSKLFAQRQQQQRMSPLHGSPSNSPLASLLAPEYRTTLSQSLVPNNTPTLDLLSSEQLLLRIQEYRRQEDERALALLRLMRTGASAGAYRSAWNPATVNALVIRRAVALAAADSLASVGRGNFAHLTTNSSGLPRTLPSDIAALMHALSSTVVTEGNGKMTTRNG